MKKIRWGIVGPGFIANKFADALSNVDDAVLFAVSSTNVSKAEDFARIHNIPKVFETYEQMAISDEIDAVYISTIHPFHKPSAEIFIKNKKHVLCEKPLCVNANEARKLQSLAKENNVFLMEAMWTAFLPAIECAKKLVSDGVIGEVKSTRASFCYRMEPSEDPKLFDNSLAGGSLLDVGVYGLYFSSLFSKGKPECISSVSRVENGVDLQMEVLLRYPSNVLSLVSSAIDLEKEEDAVIYGTEGMITIPHFYRADTLYVKKGDSQKCIEKPFLGNGFEEEIIHFTECVNNNLSQSPIHPLEKSIEILEIMDEIRKNDGIIYADSDN
ncbi:MAG: Gfo/Idh/MocA family oxidoreductase [Ruminococcaceae bacterium]|nr:Gfo/Idh/MocA family oxidoreductase [Oscillospiraceae bacterium]